MLKNMLTLVAAGLLMGALTACNTVEGAGEGAAQDAREVGDELEQDF